MKLLILYVLLLMVLITGCMNRKNDKINDSNTLVIYSPHPLEFIDPIISEFENETGIAVEVFLSGTGELLERIEAKKSHSGDILWGGSLSTLEAKKELFDIYFSKNEEYSLYKNVDGLITRFTAVPSVIMVNTHLIGDIQVEGYEDLLNPKLKGHIAFADPHKSSSSFEQLINQLYAMGNNNPEDGWDYVEKLMQQLDGSLLNGSSAVYKGVANGEHMIGLTFEEAAAKYVRDGAPIKIVYPKEGTIIRPDGVAIIKNAQNTQNAREFVDFVTSKEIQTLIVNELNRRSVRSDVKAAKGLKSNDFISKIVDDHSWAATNKAQILKRYKELFDSLNKID